MMQTQFFKEWLLKKWRLMLNWEFMQTSVASYLFNMVKQNDMTNKMNNPESHSHSTLIIAHTSKPQP